MADSLQHNQCHTFRTRVGWWYWLSIFLFLAIGCFPMNSDKWLIVFLLWAGAVYMFSLVFLTRYVVERDSLTVFYGFFLKLRIPVSAITSVRPTHNPLGSPALSLRRLAIRYNRYDKILVSPQDPKAFIAALQMVNPHIIAE